MRAALGLFTALPLGWEGDGVEGAWRFTAAAGLLIGIAWLVFHQALAGLGLGPFAAAGSVLVIDTVFTGARGLRGVAGTAASVTATQEVPAGPGASGSGAAAVASLMVLRGSLLVLLARLPAVMILAPLAGRVAQTLLLRDDDARSLKVEPPRQIDRVTLLITTVPLLLAPLLLGRIVIPQPSDPAVHGLGMIPLGALALLAGLVVGGVAMAWIRARMGEMTADGWHASGMAAEIAALMVVVARASGVT